jgi:acyl-coenzyme A synthetase/AMP-(fatty) acid ligase
MRQLAVGCGTAHGRADHTVNLGGIELSAREIERVVATHPARATT